MTDNEKKIKATHLLKELCELLKTDEPEYAVKPCFENKYKSEINPKNWQAEFSREVCTKVLTASNAEGHGACPYCGG